MFCTFIKGHVCKTVCVCHVLCDGDYSCASAGTGLTTFSVVVLYIRGHVVAADHRDQHPIRCFGIMVLVLALAVLGCGARYVGHTEYRPIQDVCRQTIQHHAAFSVRSNAVVAGVAVPQLTMYCMSHTASVPSTYWLERTLRLAATQYSLWAEVDYTAVGSMTTSACEQQLKAVLCPREHETPLFIVGLPKATSFECRCQEGFFRNTALVDAATVAICVACADCSFCPMHTNLQFE